MTDETSGTPPMSSGTATSDSDQARRSRETDYLILLWLPHTRTWQELGKVTAEGREEALEAGLALPECPGEQDRPALVAVALRVWAPQIVVPQAGHEWRAFVPAGTDAPFPDPDDGLGVEVG